MRKVKQLTWQYKTKKTKSIKSGPRDKKVKKYRAQGK